MENPGIRDSDVVSHMEGRHRSSPGYLCNISERSGLSLRSTVRHSFSREGGKSMCSPEVGNKDEEKCPEVTLINGLTAQRRTTNILRMK